MLVLLYIEKSLFEKMCVLLLHQVTHAYYKSICVLHHKHDLESLEAIETFLVLTIAVMAGAKIGLSFDIEVVLETIEMTIEPEKFHI